MSILVVRNPIFEQKFDMAAKNEYFGNKKAKIDLYQVYITTKTTI